MSNWNRNATLLLLAIVLIGVALFALHQTGQWAILDLMTEQICSLPNWLLGLAFSLGLGRITVPVFLRTLRKWMKLPKRKELPGDVRRVPSWLMGAMEQCFFTIAVGFKFPGVVIAMLAWLGIKMATNWNRPGESSEEGMTPENRVQYSHSAALAGLLSMGFALIGGLIWRGDLP